MKARQADVRFNIQNWQDLYRLVEEPLVNITNLTVRLQRLGMIYLRDGDKRIYRSKDDVTGQGFAVLKGTTERNNWATVQW